ncbi:copper resistance protein B [Novosphingobium sp. FSY-8]|uniref:Copper resistance protein B n=1 Tax=Novosphingobium ovatum TaxID=1908523 RepID=A0ABW9XD50_9SPHN|nr:copper resistance protein B [Novosphingobium ovatum]NBC36422.1 copper resistance protein B [Novosphingobium ovatum]
MKTTSSLAAMIVALALPGIAHAQDHSQHQAAAPAVTPATPVTPVPAPRMGGTDADPGSAPPPAPIHDRAADAHWGAAAMAPAEHAMMSAHSAPVYSAVHVDMAEYRFGRGGDGFAVEGEGWVGDLNRLTLATRIEGEASGAVEHAEIRAAYARAITPWWNVLAGVRQDVGPVPNRTHAMLGLSGMAPYRFEVLAALFLSDKGQLTARAEASYDQRITRRLILQPRVEVNLSAQDMPDQHTGAGLTGIEAGLRLGYEISRKLVPYVGMHWNWATGATADYARAEGQAVASRAVVVGLRGWF